MTMADGRTIYALTDEYRIPSSADPDARIFVRRSVGGRGVPVLLVHGFSQPASAILDVPGYSLLHELAGEGLIVYLFDLRGYGRSSRPAFMSEPAGLSKPSLGCMRDAVADISDVVSFILEREHASAVDLLGYSWGTARSASFAIHKPDLVRRLVLYAPVWRPSGGAVDAAMDPRNPQQLNPALGGYATARLGELEHGWDGEIPSADKSLFREAAAVHAADIALADSDPFLREPHRGYRSPLGPMLDAMDVIRGHPLFDPARVTQPALLLRGAEDPRSSHDDAWNLFQRLGSLQKRIVTIGTGSHLLHLERNRYQLIDEITAFLKSVRSELG